MPRSRRRSRPRPATSGFGSSIGDHDAADAGLGDARRARAGAAGVGARLERAVQRRAARPRAGLVERKHLGVRPAGPLVRAPADDHALVVDDDGADHRVRDWCVPRPRSASCSARP